MYVLSKRLTLRAVRSLHTRKTNVGTRVTYSVYDMLMRCDFLDNNKLVPSLASC